MTLALLMCIGLTMVMLGRDVDGPEGSDQPVMDVAKAASNPTDLGTSQRLALDDEIGAIERALSATAAPRPQVQPAGVQTASVQTASVQSVGPTTLQPMGQLHYVTGNRVNVRSGPSTANDVVDQVVRDQRVEVLDETPDGWMRIRIVDTGTEAFIFGRFLAPLAG
ncbi:SH3 domain-containing protein [Maribius pontilimi]|uniref:SH3 domain-containing protein n=1 Tax=Palleronia pontilimi TaxID=1964209 RepID=A0A934MHS6_9RHOB|nr:SH3 domain-containing protein [Palleronia pontilimi]MBJ3763579.1 SH3 domain-containing protein [Palleronia pontilimi]